jgi:bacterioferritin-associated ferredoxin
MDEMICYCQQVTKREIEKAISDGAKTLKDIQEITGACTGNQCKELNPSGKCCSSAINAMLPKTKFKMAATCDCGHC